jgi:hypothetical protein
MKLFTALLFVLLFSGCLHAKSDAEATAMVWMRPNSFGVDVNGYQIVRGPDYELMQFLAKAMPEFAHRFESYPLNRSWQLIKTQSNETQVYCFYGASKTTERAEWGVFSKPTSILLPYPVVAIKGAFDHMVKDGYLSLERVFYEGKTTVIFDGVVNRWTNLVAQTDASVGRILKMNQGTEDAGEVTARLIKGGRIDFGFVGSGRKEIEQLEAYAGIEFSVYQLQENAGKFSVGNRVMCSNTETGEKAMDALDNVLLDLLSDPKSNAEFRDLNFDVIGYHPNLKSSFDRYWSAFTKEHIKVHASHPVERTH